MIHPESSANLSQPVAPAQAGQTAGKGLPDQEISPARAAQGICKPGAKAFALIEAPLSLPTPGERHGYDEVDARPRGRLGQLTAIPTAELHREIRPVMILYPVQQLLRMSATGKE